MARRVKGIGFTISMAEPLTPEQERDRKANLYDYYHSAYLKITEALSMPPDAPVGDVLLKIQREHERLTAYRKAEHKEREG